MCNWWLLRTQHAPWMEAVVRGYQKRELLLGKHANWEGDKLILRVYNDVLSFLNLSLTAAGLTAVDKL